MNDKPAIVTIIFGAKEEAIKTRSECIRRGFAASGHIFPIDSAWVYKGEYEEAEEWQLELRTMSKMVDEIEAVVRGIHSYETFEMLVTIPERWNPEWGEWVVGCVKKRFA